MSNLALGGSNFSDRRNVNGFLILLQGLSTPGSLPTGDGDEAQSGPWF